MTHSIPTRRSSDLGGVVEIQYTSALIVTDHPNLRQGAKIVTTSLLWASEDWSAARTVSRFYRLGVPLSDEPTLESQDMRQCNGSIGTLLGNPLRHLHQLLFVRVMDVQVMDVQVMRSEEHPSELQPLMRI